MEEPSIPAHWRLPLAALWISAALHLAIIGLVQIRPAHLAAASTPVIEARLETTPAASAKPAARPIVATAAAHAKKAAAPPPKPPPSIPSPLSPAPPVPAAEDKPTPATSVLPNNPDTGRKSGPSVAVPLLTNPVYYPARDLDVQPHALQPIQPVYPQVALDRELSGLVKVELHVEADGQVSDAQVVSAEPPGYFDQAALAAFKHARFSPAIRHGEPVRCKILIKVKFDFGGRDEIKSLGSEQK